jgi:hypothetical protein
MLPPCKKEALPAEAEQLLQPFLPPLPAPVARDITHHDLSGPACPQGTDEGHDHHQGSQ